MPRRRKRLNWTYDDARQEFTTPGGRIVSVHDIAELLYNQLIAHHDLDGPWAGWRIRGRRIIPPGTSFRTGGIAVHQMAAFNRWLSSFPGVQAQPEFHTEKPGPQAKTSEANELPSADKESPAHTVYDPQCAHPPASQNPGLSAIPTVHEPQRRAQVIDLAMYRQQAQQNAGLYQ
jgi:hypothetical protein